MRDEFLTPRDAADLLQVSARTVRHLPIPRAQLSPRRVRYLRQDVLEYVASLRREIAR